MRVAPRSARSVRSTIPCYAVLLLLAAAGPACGQTFGEFVPVAADDSPLPANLEVQYVTLAWRFHTDLDATPANMQRILDQQFSCGYVVAHAKSAAFMNFNAPQYKKHQKLPDEPVPVDGLIDVYCDWEQSVRIDHSRFPRDLAPGESVQTEDGSFRLMRIGPDKVKILVGFQGRGSRIAWHAKVKRILAGREFQREPAEEPVMLAERDQDRIFTVYPPSSSAILTESEADRIVATLSMLPMRLASELRKPALKIVLGMPATRPGESDPGVALMVRALRICSQPREGKEAFEIPIRKLAILHRRARPPIRPFARMLASDIDDPEVIDRFRRCPPVTEQASEFTLPDGCVVPSDSWGGRKPMYKWRNGTPMDHVLKLWEVSFGANPEQKPTVLEPRGRSGAGKLIGHYYIVVDGRNTSEKVIEKTFSKSFKMSHSQYSRHLRSSETTMSLDVEVGVDIGIELGEKFSLSTTTKEENERGSSLTNEVEMTVEQKLMPPAGALLIYKIPVLLSVDRILGTSKFTFDRQVSMAPAASKLVTYRNEEGTGLLRKEESAANAENTKDMSYTLGKVISGDELIVIRRFGIDDGRLGNRFVGTWRETILSTGVRRRVDISQDRDGGSNQDGILTYEDGPEPHGPTYRLIPRSEQESRDRADRKVYMGAADMKNVRTEQVTKVRYEVRSGPMGPLSKIVIRSLEDDPIAYLVRVGDQR